MDCEEIKKIIPKYFQHSASEEEIREVEEHLCICHDCRTTLGELMDKLAEPQESQPADTQKEQPESAISPQAREDLPGKGDTPIETTQPQKEEGEKIEYFPGKGFEDSTNKEQKSEEEKELPKGADDEFFKEKTKPEKEEPLLPAHEPEETKEVFPPMFSEEKESSAFSSAAPAEGLEEAEKPLEEIKNEPAPYPPGKESRYPLDRVPLAKDRVGILEYAVLAVGLIIFIALIYLVLKG
jgi:hypothetical protein